jgi:serine/threonine protein kinase
MDDSPGSPGERTTGMKIFTDKKCSPGSSSRDQPSASTSSPASNEKSKPRSLRRIIRPDDFWQAERKSPKSASGFEKAQELPSARAPLRVLQPQEVASQRLFKSPNRLQSLQKSEHLTAKDLLAQEYSDEELKPPPLSVRKRGNSETPTVEAPPLTRELILRHLSFDSDDDSLSDQSEKPGPTADEGQLTPLERLRRIKKARRVGVIYETASSSEDEAEDEATVDKKLEEEISPMADLLHPESASAMTEHRREAVRLAKSQESAVIEKCKRGNQQMPAYSFDELIGKGSYGRVYKGRQTTTSKVVAIKVIDIDEADFHSVFEQKDEQIKDFNREIRILKQAQDSGAPNMNIMIEALPVHSQLWLVCEYCPGGSVKTLMRATNDRLSEQYIIIVARELAKALAGLHDAGIMHRDIKAANVLIHEEGRLELCDFGVATVLDTKGDKRKTFIGTPHWMPPELFVENPEYSDEVDVWEYGCTLYECALGKPPHSDLRERQQLASRMRRLKQSISLPEHEDFSEGLRDLVAYTLSPDAKSRPSMKQVLTHNYLLNTETEYPTGNLSQLVKVYYAWLHSGGQRASLFMPGGAVVSDAPGSLTTPIDEWNFSTTEVFEKRISAIMDIPDFSQTSPLDDSAGDATPRAPKDINIASLPLKEMTSTQKANFEARVQRGEVGLINIFDEAKPQYEYKTKTDFRPVLEERRVSDLPFRAMAEDRPSSIASNVIDLGDFDSEDYAIAAPMKEETIQLADAATIRAKRSDSKGPARDTSATGTTSSIGDISGTVQETPRASTHEFAFPPEEWISNDKHHVRDLEETSTSELTPNKDDGRKTMDWTFASAFPSSVDEDEEPQPATSQQNKAKKHATLEWSFSNAMAEADTSSDDDAVPSTSERTPAMRPAALLRTMTQPVTSTEVHTAEEFPRPSTAMSEAYSESSISSADFDPFALEGNRELPASMAQAMDDMGVGNYYHHNNSSLTPEHTVPYTTTVAGPAPYMLGPPARLGEPNFPGPQTGVPPSSLAQNGKRRPKQDSSGESADGRPRVDLPEAVPPSQEALALDAPAEVVESELSRLLGGLQASLAGAGQALQMMRPRKGGRKGRTTPRGRARPSSDEWEDEE